MTSSNDTTIPLKRCSKCGEEKPDTLEYFSKHRTGLCASCKECARKYKQQNRDRIIEYNRQYRRENKEELQQRYAERREELCSKRRQRYAEDSVHRVKVLEQCREYRVRNRDVVIIRSRQYYAANRDKYRQYAVENWEHKREYMRRYREENRDKLRQQQQIYYDANRDRLLGSRRLYFRQYYLCNRQRYTVAVKRYKARKRGLPCNWTVKDWQRCLTFWNHRCAACDTRLITPHADHWIPLNYCGADNPGTVPANMICLCRTCNSSKCDTLPEQWLIRKFGKEKAGEVLQRVTVYLEWVKNQ